ncbi:MAG: autotransporter outer membrane beta-barrel domain-containing protein [Muribaculaceae bacterium]|nr:autotransporter outer membrane beta-barrel domain-containing protein [Muribaculaceae bacterium]
MRKQLKNILVLVALMIMPLASHAISAPTLRTDTIFRVDTITTQETITRTEVIQKSQKVVRYYEDGNLLEKNMENGEIKEIPFDNPLKTAPQTSVSETFDANIIYVDTLYRPGGKYVWIPDSMDVKVNELLSKGEVTTSVQVEEWEVPVDLNEKVVFRGDTINMILKSRNLGRFDRGLFNYLFIPKGIWQVGLTASYGEFSTSDLEVLDLISDIDFNGKLWSIRPYFQYFFKSNLSLGLRLGYTQGRANIGSFNVDIDEDMSFNLHDIMYKSNNYSASFTFSQYLGIARKGRFGVFNEVELALSGGDSDFHRPFQGEMKRTHTQAFQAALNFSPGVCVYVLDQVSFNVSLGVFGLNIKHEKQKVDDEDMGWRTTSGANFRFNIFNINFGIAVNI